MDRQRKRLWNAFLWLVIIVLFILVSVQLIIKLLGGSWGFEAILTAALSLISAVMLKSNSDIAELKGAFKQFEKRFERLESAFAQHVGKKKH